MKKKLYLFLLFSLLIHCSKEETPKPQIDNHSTKPIIKEGGRILEFEENSKTIPLFKTQKATFLSFDQEIKAPATVIGKVKKSENSKPPIILFSSSELASTYANYTQGQTLIKLARANYSRAEDLFKHGAATGKELNDSSSDLYSKQAFLAESESKLIREGFNPKTMSNATNGTVWMISDLPETELDILKTGIVCKASFPGYPGEVFDAKIDAIAEVLNTETRKARLRIVLKDNHDKIRPGMYGKIIFSVQQSGLMVPKEAVISANARYYIFIKISQNIFERREVTISTETDVYIEISTGLQIGEDVVIENAFLLKGLSIGI